MIEVLKQMVEALEWCHGGEPVGTTEAIQSGKKLIAELESQEPVAWMTINEYGEEDDIHYENPEGHLLEGWTYKPLYTTPQPVQEESLEPFEYWNAVEGWVKIDEVRKHFGSVGCGTIYKTAGEDRVPLYTHSQRTWVGLTNEDVYEFAKAKLSWDELLIAAEAKLKERNT